jgi:hypothetical protein
MVAIVSKLRHDLATFAESMSRETLRDFLRNHGGENARSEFKERWPVFPELARDVIAIANSGGGVIIIGIAESDGSFALKGVDSVDEIQINQGLEKYLPAPLRKNCLIFTFDYKDSEYSALVGHTLQVVVIADDPQHLPFLSEKDGEKDGQKIARNVIYGRRGSSSQPASYDEIQEMVSRRIETGYSFLPELELERHFSELEFLYRQIRPTVIQGGMNQILFDAGRRLAAGLDAQSVVNPAYPNEGHDEFVARMIGAKKARIESVLDVVGMPAIDSSQPPPKDAREQL